MKHAVKADIPKCPICGKAEYTVEKTDELLWMFEFRISCDCRKFATQVEGWWSWWHSHEEIKALLKRRRAQMEQQWERDCENRRSERLAEKLARLCDVLDKHADAIANEPNAYYGRNDAIFGFTFAKKRIEAILAEEKDNT